MKKIIFIVLVLLFITSCTNKGCNKEEYSLMHTGILNYYLDDNSVESLKDIKLKITKKGKEQVLPLNHKDIKVENFKFNEVGEFNAIVTYNNESIKLKYKVSIRKWDKSINTSWYDETKDTFEIANATDLAGLAKLVNEGNTFSGKTVKLKYDIDLNNEPWNPIGTSGVGKFGELKNVFSGTFDGNNKTIYNLKYKATHETRGEHIKEDTSYYHYGLFGYVKNATFKNILLSDITILNGMGNNFVRSLQGTGSLIGHSSGELNIDNVNVCGKIVINGEYKVGGLIGSISGSNAVIKNVTVSGTEGSIISGTDEEYKDTNNFGGVVGFISNESTIFENITTNINVNGFTSGGVIGNVSEGICTLKNAKVHGTISNTEGSTVGGFIGGRFATLNLTDCYLLGSVTAKDKSYADVAVSNYGIKESKITINNVYYIKENIDPDFIHNTLNAKGVSKEEMNELISKK